MTWAPKSSNGRNTRAPAQVPEVETLACGDGLHRLTNRMVRDEAVTCCVGCGASWAAIDAASRSQTLEEA